jgi:hypothetical protein
MDPVPNLEPIPRPPGHIGNIFDVNTAHPTEGLAELARKYGPIYELEVPGCGSRIIASSFEFVDPLCDESGFDKKVGSGLRQLAAGPAGTRPVHVRDARPELAQGAQRAPACLQHGRYAWLSPAHARCRDPAHAQMGAAEPGRHGGRSGRHDKVDARYDRALRLRLPVQLLLSRHATSLRPRPLLLLSRPWLIHASSTACGRG